MSDEKRYRVTLKNLYKTRGCEKKIFESNQFYDPNDEKIRSCVYFSFDSHRWDKCEGGPEILFGGATTCKMKFLVKSKEVAKQNNFRINFNWYNHAQIKANNGDVYHMESKGFFDTVCIKKGNGDKEVCGSLHNLDKHFKKILSGNNEKWKL